ncbi:PadR family transcriptional regulator [Clostridium sp. Mt-5]|uniref:PadR family transcriptional regulator n=1 Tax=Clostridium moutaii TaxID=3240932 RepID=A0ABV4BJQ5_9CLOT
MAKVNKTKYALLGVLSIMSGSGYDIKKFCDSSISHFWNENYGHIYPVLQKMEKEELITKKVEQSQGRPSKNVYSITKKGREELRKWLMLPAEQEPLRSELLLKIFWSKNIPVQNIIEKVSRIKSECEFHLKHYREVENYLKQNREKIGDNNLSLWLITLNFGINDSEGKIKWCEDTIEILKSME